MEFIIYLFFWFFMSVFNNNLSVFNTNLYKNPPKGKFCNSEQSEIHFTEMPQGANIYVQLERNVLSSRRAVEEGFSFIFSHNWNVVFIYPAFFPELSKGAFLAVIAQQINCILNEAVSNSNYLQEGSAGLNLGGAEELPSNQERAIELYCNQEVTTAAECFVQQLSLFSTVLKPDGSMDMKTSPISSPFQCKYSRGNGTWSQFSPEEKIAFFKMTKYLLVEAINSQDNSRQNAAWKLPHPILTANREKYK